MLKRTDDLDAVAKSYKAGELAVEELHVYLAPRLEFVPENEARDLLNDLEVAAHTLAEPGRQVRVLEILEDASRVARDYAAPDDGSV